MVSGECNSLGVKEFVIVVGENYPNKMECGEFAKQIPHGLLAYLTKLLSYTQLYFCYTFLPPHFQ